MTVKEIIEESMDSLLTDRGYDGLCNSEEPDGCACFVGDLFPCVDIEDCMNCEAGYKCEVYFDGKWRRSITTNIKERGMRYSRNP